MKKIMALFLSACLFTLPCLCQSILSLSFTDIDGNSVSLSSYEGKKIIFIVAPVSASDSVRLDEIKKFQFRFGIDSIKLVGIMSIEDGYSSGNNSTIKSLYQSKGINIVLTTGMYTRKSAGTNQSALMKWLTDKNENSRYDTDVQGIGHKFFIGKSGKLYAIIPPNFSLLNNNVIGLLYRNM